MLRIELAAVAFALWSAACANEVVGGSTGGSSPGGSSAGGNGAVQGGAGGDGGEFDWPCTKPVDASAEDCEALATQDECEAHVIPGDLGLFCRWHVVEMFPADTCSNSVLVERCLAHSSGTFGGCGLGDCPAKPANDYYEYRTCDDGSVEINYVAQSACNTMDPPFGYDMCYPDDNHPEACKCNCL